MNFDLTISLGTILETCVLLGGGIATLTTLRNTVKALKDEQVTFKEEIKAELEKLGEVLINMARFEERITNLDKRITSHGRQIDELRRGEGLIRGHGPFLGAGGQ